MNKFKVGDLVKFKKDKLYKSRWNRNNPEKSVILPVAGIILSISIDDWLHPYYAMSKHFEHKETKVEVATVKWFEYSIPEIGASDDFNLDQYNKHYTKVPTSRLCDFNNYVESLKKKKVLYK